MLPGADAAAKRFIVPMTLISFIARDETTPEFMTRKVWMIVSTLVAATMRLRMRVVLVDPHELGALELDLGGLGVEADDDLDVGVGLELLGHPAAPEGAQPGDQDAAAHPQPFQTERRARIMSKSWSWMRWRMSSAASMTLLLL